MAQLRQLSSSTPMADAYLALHFTPIRDLLADAGETWNFGQKTPLLAFKDAQKRLKAWSSSRNAAIATKHAYQVLLAALSTSDAHPSPFSDISSYWLLYTSVLIIRSFSTAKSAHDPAAFAMKLETRDAYPVDARASAREYLAVMAQWPVEKLMLRAPARGEMGCVVDAVRATLELDGVGGKCGWIIDAIGVLRKLSVGV